MMVRKTVVIFLKVLHLLKTLIILTSWTLVYTVYNILKHKYNQISNCNDSLVLSYKIITAPFSLKFCGEHTRHLKGKTKQRTHTSAPPRHVLISIVHLMLTICAPEICYIIEKHSMFRDTFVAFHHLDSPNFLKMAEQKYHKHNNFLIDFFRKSKHYCVFFMSPNTEENKLIFFFLTL